jgi:prepilin-type N-terminal cleavage/methylation domain-containing protein
MHQRVKGFSLIEMIFVIVVAAMIALLAVRYFASSRFNLKVTSAVSQIQQITGASYQWLNTHAQLDFTGGDVPNGVAISMTELVNTECLGNNYTQDPWGGTIAVNADPSAPTLVKITLPGASLKACNNLKQRLANKAQSQIQTCTANSGYYGSF